MAVVRQAFRPEFLNRLDEIILFNRLGRIEMRRIVDIQLQQLQRLLADRKITFKIDDTAKTWLANTGYDPVMAPAHSSASFNVTCKIRSPACCSPAPSRMVKPSKRR